jgi:hypothetical protein
MIDILWKFLFKKAGCTPDSIAEVERIIVAERRLIG